MAMTKSEESAAVLANMDVVRKLARKYGTCGVDLEDLEQEGMIGFLKGMRKWSPEGGASLRTYSAQWAEVYVRRAVGSETRGGKLIVEDREVSLDAQVGGDGDGDRSLHEIVASESFEDPEEAYQRKERIEMVQKALPPVEASILRQRYEGVTYDMIGARLGISRSLAHKLKTDAVGRPSVRRAS